MRTAVGLLVFDPANAVRTLTTEYADQAHLARESVAITGVAPSELLAGTERNCGENHNHAPTYFPLLRARQRASQPH